VGTVKNHVHRILQKLDVSSREDAAAYLAFIE
jgi:DNA-binding NarL/FixJ family response regulator